MVQRDAVAEPVEADPRRNAEAGFRHRRGRRDIAGDAEVGDAVGLLALARDSRAQRDFGCRQDLVAGLGIAGDRVGALMVALLDRHRRARHRRDDARSEDHLERCPAIVGVEIIEPRHPFQRSGRCGRQLEFLAELLRAGSRRDVQDLPRRLVRIQQDGQIGPAIGGDALYRHAAEAMVELEGGTAAMQFIRLVAIGVHVVAVAMANGPPNTTFSKVPGHCGSRCCASRRLLRSS